MISVKEAANFFKKHDSFLILSHRRPDGDALGSAAGLVYGLREYGKTAYMLYNPEITGRYTPYLDSRLYPPDGFVPEHLVSVDMANEKIIQINAKDYTGRIELCLDHHMSNADYAAKTLLMSGRASCGEVVLQVLKELAGGVSAKTAEMLYIALSSDTGCFRYKNTTDETFEAAAELVKAGADNGTINKKIFMTQKRSRLRLESLIIENLEFFKDGEMVVAIVDNTIMQKAGADNDDLEDIAVIAGQIEGIEVSITITELKDGGCKASVRTVYYANADKICSQLGGGGHGMAAGCSFDCTPDEAKRLLVEAAEKVWKQG